jgi:mRNA interferase RelE/StbE
VNQVEFTKSAKKELANLPENIRQQIGKRIRELSEEPFPAQCKKLFSQDAFRVRSGDYRIIYNVNSNRVIILAIGNRKDIYR